MSYKFEIGEVVQMAMGRAVYSHFDGELAVITERFISPRGHELYRMNPIDPTLQQRVRFDVGSLRKILNGVPEPFSKVHYDQLALPKEIMQRKEVKLNNKYWNIP